VKRLAAYFVLASVLFAVPGIGAAEDLAAGDASFHKWCQACHAVGVGAKNKFGPELNGLPGRQAGTAEGYQYSPAGKERGLRLGSDQLRRVHRQSEGEDSREQDGVRWHQGRK
jgi:cytochrome c